jgi:hypothetical protein
VRSARPGARWAGVVKSFFSPFFLDTLPRIKKATGLNGEIPELHAIFIKLILDNNTFAKIRDKKIGLIE